MFRVASLLFFGTLPSGCRTAGSNRSSLHRRLRLILIAYKFELYIARFRSEPLIAKISNRIDCFALLGSIPFLFFWGEWFAYVALRMYFGCVFIFLLKMLASSIKNIKFYSGSGWIGILVSDSFLVWYEEEKSDKTTLYIPFFLVICESLYQI